MTITYNVWHLSSLLLPYPLFLSLLTFLFPFCRSNFYDSFSIIHPPIPLNSSDPPCLGQSEFFFWKPILPDRWSENTFHTILFLSRNRISSCTFLFQAYKYMKKQIKDGPKFTEYQVMNCLDSFHGWFRFRTDYPIEICRSHTLDWLFGKIT